MAQRLDRVRRLQRQTKRVSTTGLRYPTVIPRNFAAGSPYHGVEPRYLLAGERCFSPELLYFAAG